MAALLAKSSAFQGSAVVAAPRARSAARSSFSVQAKLSKAADFRAIATEDLRKEVEAAKRSLFDLRMKQATRQARNEFKPHMFSEVRRKVAQMMTLVREREIENGVSSRDSKKAAKAASNQLWRK